MNPPHRPRRLTDTGCLILTAIALLITIILAALAATIV
jgi:hypothetical protein